MATLGRLRQLEIDRAEKKIVDNEHNNTQIRLLQELRIKALAQTHSTLEQMVQFTSPELEEAASSVANLARQPIFAHDERFMARIQSTLDTKRKGPSVIEASVLTCIAELKSHLVTFGTVSELANQSFRSDQEQQYQALTTIMLDAMNIGEGGILSQRLQDIKTQQDTAVAARAAMATKAKSDAAEKENTVEQADWTIKLNTLVNTQTDPDKYIEEFQNIFSQTPYANTYIYKTLKIGLKRGEMSLFEDGAARDPNKTLIKGRLRESDLLVSRVTTIDTKTLADDFFNSVDAEAFKNLYIEKVLGKLLETYVDKSAATKVDGPTKFDGPTKVDDDDLDGAATKVDAPGLGRHAVFGNGGFGKMILFLKKFKINKGEIITAIGEDTATMLQIEKGYNGILQKVGKKLDQLDRTDSLHNLAKKETKNPLYDQNEKKVWNLFIRLTKKSTGGAMVGVPLANALGTSSVAAEDGVTVVDIYTPQFMSDTIKYVKYIMEKRHMDDELHLEYMNTLYKNLLDEPENHSLISDDYRNAIEIGFDEAAGLIKDRRMKDGILIDSIALHKERISKSLEKIKTFFDDIEASIPIGWSIPTIIEIKPNEYISLHYLNQFLINIEIYTFTQINLIKHILTNPELFKKICAPLLFPIIAYLINKEEDPNFSRMIDEISNPASIDYIKKQIGMLADEEFDSSFLLKDDGQEL